MVRECSPPTRCQVSGVTCIFFFIVFQTKWWSYLVEGLLSMGFTQSNFWSNKFFWTNKKNLYPKIFVSLTLFYLKQTFFIIIMLPFKFFLSIFFFIFYQNTFLSLFAFFFKNISHHKILFITKFASQFFFHDRKMSSQFFQIFFFFF